MVASALTAALASSTGGSGASTAAVGAAGFAGAASAAGASGGLPSRRKAVVGSAPVTSSLMLRKGASAGRGASLAISASAASSTTTCYATPPRTLTRPGSGTRFAPSRALRRVRRGTGVNGGEDGGDEEPPADGGGGGDWTGGGGSGGSGGVNPRDWGDFGEEDGDGWYNDETRGEARGQAVTALLSALALGGGTVGAARAVLGGGEEDGDAGPPGWVRALYGRAAPTPVAAVPLAPVPVAVAAAAGQ